MCGIRSRFFARITYFIVIGSFGRKRNHCYMNVKKKKKKGSNEPRVK